MHQTDDNVLTHGKAFRQMKILWVVKVGCAGFARILARTIISFLTVKRSYQNKLQKPVDSCFAGVSIQLQKNKLSNVFSEKKEVSANLVNCATILLDPTYWESRKYPRLWAK